MQAHRSACILEHSACILEHSACILELSAFILKHSACILELSACILEHAACILENSACLWNILHAFWNILEHFPCILGHSGPIDHRQTDRHTDGHTHIRTCWAASSQLKTYHLGNILHSLHNHIPGHSLHCCTSSSDWESSHVNAKTCNIKESSVSFF